MYQGNVLVAGTYTNSSGQVTVFHGVCEQFVQEVPANENVPTNTISVDFNVEFCMTYIR